MRHQSYRIRLFLEDISQRRYALSMSFNEVIAELPRLTFEERQILIRRALELDDPPLSAAEEELIETRLAAHHANPNSSVSLDEMKARLRSRSKS
jgi:putative addiction module component (TIGR02574 family)